MTQHDLEAIIKGGENDKVEFKRNISSDISKELTAFANSSGGRVFVGVEDDGVLHGIPITNEIRSRIQSIARDCDPAVSVELENFNDVMIIHIPEGKNKPYRCNTGFYIRNGASSIKLSTQEIIEFIKSENRVRFEELHTPSFNYPLHLDEAAVSRYVDLSHISGVIRTNELLTNLGVIYDDSTDPILNNAGVLFFTKEPAKLMPHATVTCVLFKGNGKVHIIDKKTFEFDLITNINEAISFLERHLNISYQIVGLRRTEILEIPVVALREAIVNAVTHRDYFEKGANVSIEIFDNRIVISNPGGLPKGLKPENFGTHSLTRNPLIAALLHRCHYIEKVGTGIHRMRESMKEANLPDPIFEFSSFFAVTLHRNETIKIRPEQELNTSSARRKRLIAIARKLREDNALDLGSLALQLNTTDRTLRRDMKELEKYGLVKSSGATRDKKYMLTSEGLIYLKEIEK
jgi:ATP-dependent DNA helicase RecG